MRPKYGDTPNSHSTYVKTAQNLKRNGKMYTFFPDILIDDHVKGFLVDQTAVAAESALNALWVEFTSRELMHTTPHYFSIHISEALSESDSQLLFVYYVALPTNQVTTSGEPLVTFCSVVKKHRL